MQQLLTNLRLIFIIYILHMQQWRVLRDSLVQDSNKKMTNVFLTISQPPILKTHLIPAPKTPPTSTEHVSEEIVCLGNLSDLLTSLAKLLNNWNVKLGGLNHRFYPTHLEDNHFKWCVMYMLAKERLRFRTCKNHSNIPIPIAEFEFLNSAGMDQTSPH